ncbi:MAG: N-6 DNA methylase, partial [Sphingomonadales bacterium]|nr:N-6 DNA methylase [Sphingomonadales bacterium]
FGQNEPNIPQVVCEFKGFKSGASLDDPQPRKGNTRSPVKQALDYLAYARRGLFGNEPVLPRYTIVTNMEEFRLYWFDRAPERYLRFSITGGDLFNTITLLGADEEAQFDRFLFWRLFQPDMLLSSAGRTQLERLIEKQGKAERTLEKEFYKEYTDYRLALYNVILTQKPDDMTRGQALRLAQKILDRFIFIMFAEDMGERVAFPPSGLQTELKEEAARTSFEPNDTSVWNVMRRLFRSMNEGGRFGGNDLFRFNGGLFEHDPEIGALELPNHLFCRRGQGANEATIAEHKKTLLYLAATYNFAAEGDAKENIGLYSLGHIFEQSIVDLEKLEAEAEGRESLAKLSKRKSDGVYYTPEWVVRKIVTETLDPLFALWRKEAGLVEDEEAKADAARSYWDRLTKIRVVDPACGSGAFLITAFRYLLDEFDAAQTLAIAAGGLKNRKEEYELIEMILDANIYGVDINPASVEITKLSLWLHTAKARQPLSGLDHTIRCGNSLVDERFYDKRGLYDAEERERINDFNWESAFPEIFNGDDPGFDAVVGNPPYVKLQNLKKVHPDMAEWLVAGSNGNAPYRSTTTGNFDLYLPFIEKGLSLLNRGGRMGYIAPSLWPTLQYGAGLRSIIKEGRHLEKWLDLRAFQVFEDVTTYTALQIFTAAGNENLRLGFAPDGDVSAVDWSDADNRIGYGSLPATREWLLAPGPIRNLRNRLGKVAKPLGSGDVVKGIHVGVQTSADYIYHLRRIANGRYVQTVGTGKDKAETEVEIEDEIMRPLVSGAEAKRFLEPETDTWLLFPYALDGDGARLRTPKDMQANFPKAWRYLKSWEQELRARESGKFDCDGWYQFGRNQNIDKQEQAKVLVPRLVPALRAAADPDGRFYCDNVDVGGVVPQQADDLWYLTGLLNCPTWNSLFYWLSKPFQNNYLSANRQFIAPLPVPKANDGTGKEALSLLAESLQTNHTRRRDILSALAERLEHCGKVGKPLEWLLSDIQSMETIRAGLPDDLDARERKAAEDEIREGQEETALAAIEQRIRPGSSFDVAYRDGQLSFLADGAPVARAYVDDDQAELLTLQWRMVALTFEPAARGNAKRLVDRLRSVAVAAESVVLKQLQRLAADLEEVSGEIEREESTLHEVTCVLFELSDDERRLVEQQR